MHHTNHQSSTALGAALIFSTLSMATVPAHANEILGNEGIRLAVDTVIEFEFVESNGSYQSTFGIINLDTQEHFPIYQEVRASDRFQPIAVPSDGEDDTGLNNQDDFQGTPGTTVLEHLKEFTAAANTNYTFYLDSYYEGHHAGTLYSTNNLNDGRQHAHFEQCYGIYQPAERCIQNAITPGGLILRWEDSGSLLVGAENSDNDYDDFIVRIGGYLIWNRPGDGCYQRLDDQLDTICEPNAIEISETTE